MSDENNEMVQNELDELKQYCDDNGIGYHPSIGLDKLRIKIDAFHSAQATEEAKESVKESQVKSKAQRQAEKRNNARKLVRCRITCMNPHKREWPGEYVTVSNALGTWKRMIPFNGEPWHVENIMFEALKARVFRQSYDVPDGKGGKVRKNRFVSEFAIEVLDPLTEQELKELAADQKARGAIE